MKGKKVKVIAGIIVSVVAIALTLFLVKQQQDTRQGASGEPASLSFDPATSHSASDTNFTVAIKLTTLTSTVNVVTLETEVKYDPAKFELLTYDKNTISDKLSLVGNPVPNNIAGSFRFTVIKKSFDSSVVSGVLNLGTLTFKAKTNDSNNITFINSKLTQYGISTPVTPGVAAHTHDAIVTVPTNTSVPPTAVPPTAVPPTTGCATTPDRKSEGDANCNKKVDMKDLEIWRAEYLSKIGNSANFNYNYSNKDSVVSLRDFTIWRFTCMKNRTECALSTTN